MQLLGEMLKEILWNLKNHKLLGKFCQKFFLSKHFRNSIVGARPETDTANKQCFVLKHICKMLTKFFCQIIHDLKHFNTTM